ncbi:MAG: glycosyltransferase family 2 protein [Eubacteriales bacterium]|jgi:glycosyltransferase involved in cell wall biosynthesis|nr:glycosyltransferase family 2 protein [Eubacteriales bacterium]
MDKIAVLIPCYNEAVTIEKVVKDWQSSLPEAVIYVYDNNSTDRTDEIARAAGAVVRYERRQGKGNVIRRMFREIDAECYVMVDGDDTYPAEAGPEMVRDVLEGGADMVVGDRLSSTYFTENKRPFHNFGNSFTRFVINRMFDSDIKDIMTGLRAFSYEFVKTFPVLSKGFEIETEMTIHALDRNMAVRNVVVEYRDRPEGSSSKLNTVSDGLRVIKTMFALYKNYKPAQFFGLIGLILAVVGIGMFIPVFHDFVVTGLVERFPTLIVSGFMIMAAILSFFTGLMLQTMIQKDRMAFEFRLQVARDMHLMKRRRARARQRRQHEESAAQSGKHYGA